MLPEIESFGHLMIARRAGGEPVGLVRSPEEVVFLAFDASIKRLVELHILRSGKTLDSVAKKSAFDRAKLAAEIRGPSFMRILDVGEEKGLVYYTSNLNDGEFIEDYVKRRGPLYPATVFSLVFQLLEDLLQLKKYPRLVAQMRLDRVVVTTLEDTFLQLRVYDYGLSSTEAEEAPGAKLVVHICKLMFLMLTGKTHEGDNPDRYPVLTALPMSLRTAMRAALTDPASSPKSLERVRDDVREAIGAMVSNINARNPRKQLAMIAALQPRSQLQDLLLENVPVEIILGNRFRAEGEDHVRRYPFSIPCLNTKNDQLVTVHLLPPSRIVEKSQYEAVPLQMWRFNAARHPNILRSLSLWESPDWTFLTEEREPGFALSRLLAERITLNPQEVAVLLRQVQAGQEQALECGVQRLDLHPSNIVLRVGKNGALLGREHDRLMHKRLDAWPAFHVKLRAHLTMRNLYEPPLVDKPEQGEHAETHLADRDYRSRSFIALAAYLLTGQRQTSGSPRFPDATPELLADFVQECLVKSLRHGQAPIPAEFLLQFEGLMYATSRSTPSLANRLRGVTVPLGEMESVGSISDYENDWGSSKADADTDLPLTPISRQLKPTDFNTRKRNEGIGWPGWVAAASVMLALTAWWLLTGDDPRLLEKAPPMVKTVPEKPASIAASKTDPEKPKPISVAASQPPTPSETPMTVVKTVAPVIPPKVKTSEEPKPSPVMAVTKPQEKAPEVKPVTKPAPMPTPAVVAVTPPEKAPEVKPVAKPTPMPAPAVAAVKPPEKAPEVKSVAKPAHMPAPAVAAVKLPEKAPKVKSVAKPAPMPTPAVVAVTPPEKAPEVKPVAKPAHIPAPAIAAVKLPEKAPEVKPVAKPAPVPTPAIAAKPPQKTQETKPEMANVTPPEVKSGLEISPAPEPVVRKAIMPTPEEIARFKQGLAASQAPAQPAAPNSGEELTGSIPTISVSRPASAETDNRQ